MYRELRARRLSEDLYSALDPTLTYSERQSRKTALYEQALAEIDAEQTAVAATLSAEVLTSPLVSKVVHFYKEAAEAALLTAEMNTAIAEITEHYTKRIPHFRRQIESYEKARIDLLLSRIEAAGLEVCYDCGKAKAGVELVLVAGRRISAISDCMSTATWAEDFSTLKRICKNCQQSAILAPETSYTDGSKEMIHSFVYEIEVREDGSHAHFNDGWGKVAEKTRELKRDYTGAYGISRSLATEWNIPPALKCWGDKVYITHNDFYDDLLLDPSVISS
jgi:hypothetical protein